MKRRVVSAKDGFPHLGTRKGVALVSVLMVLGLMLVLVISLLNVSLSGKKQARMFQDSLRRDDLVDLVSALVVSQVRNASSQSEEKEGHESWTSQPGALHRWAEDGTLERGFRLYSSHDLVFRGDAKTFLQDRPPLDWNQYPERYTDLNVPAQRQISGKAALFFPVIDPRAAMDVAGSLKIEGFSLDKTVAPSGMVDTGPELARRLPLPVEWLYVLQDGTLGSLDVNRKFQGERNPSEQNPIVARVAFWTDDETCKLNLNTASEPTYWATPSFQHAVEREWALAQPTFGEFQRFPGHPATVSLSPVLRPGFDSGLTKVERLTRFAWKESLYGILPKLHAGGSKGGTQNLALNFDSLAGSPVFTDAIDFTEASGERLLAEVEEILFASDRTRNALDAGMKWENVPVSTLDRGRFFLTTHSEAPELNLWGEPRVAVWPTDVKSDNRTSYDELVRFCSSFPTKEGSRLLGFERANADSETADLDWEPNRKLLEHLEYRLQSKVPGYGGSLASRWKEDTSQILLEAFDYVRSTNLQDAFLAKAIEYASPYDHLSGRMYGYDSRWPRPLDFKTFTDPMFRRRSGYDLIWGAMTYVRGFPGAGFVTPSYWKAREARGMGRFLTISEVGLHFICCADGTPNQYNPIPDGSGGGAAPKVKTKGTTVMDVLDDQDDARYNQSWYSNFPPYPEPNPRAGQAPDLAKYPGTEGYPYGADPKHPGYHWKNWNCQLDDGKPLPKGMKRVQMMVRLEWFSPSAGYGLMDPELAIKVKGLSSFTLEGVPLFPKDEAIVLGNQRWDHWGCYQVGAGGFGVKSFDKDRRLPSRGSVGQAQTMEFDQGYDHSYWRTPGGLGLYNYDLVSIFVDVPASVMKFGGGSLTFELYNDHKMEVVLQTIHMDFPVGTFPVPTLVTDPQSESRTYDEMRERWYTSQPIHPPRWWSFYYQGCLGRIKPPGNTNNPSDLNRFKVPVKVPAVGKALQVKGLWDRSYRAMASRDATQDYLACDSWYEDCMGRYWNENSDPSRWRPGSVRMPGFGAYIYGFDRGDVREKTSGRFAPDDPAGGWEVIEQREGSDVMQSVVFRPGDLRLAMGRKVVGNRYWEPHRLWGKQRLAHNLAPISSDQIPGFDFGDTMNGRRLSELPANRQYHTARYPVTAWTEEATARARITGDFDNGLPILPDGPYINKPDEGNLWYRTTIDGGSPRIPYFDESWEEIPSNDGFFSPNRMVAGPGVFGSLPTGVKRDLTWQTLLLRPQQGHSGAELPPDHLFLDLFWMPVVQPYALSSRFATRGKINLNQQLLPFPHVKRQTGLHGLLKGEYVTAVPADQSWAYKAGLSASLRIHRKINLPETLKQWDDRYAAGTLFRSGSEICSVHLVPETLGKEVKWTAANMALFWKTFSVTGDETRERPYTNVHAKVTTQSNSWRIHYRVQTLAKARSVEPGIVDESRDRVTGDHQGSMVLQRYLDPNGEWVEPAPASSWSVEKDHQFRIISRHRFAR